LARSSPDSKFFESQNSRCLNPKFPPVMSAVLLFIKDVCTASRETRSDQGLPS
jgi:hypothetical protein